MTPHHPDSTPDVHPSVTAMLGEWQLMATTSGYFTFRQRVAHAVFVVGPIHAGRVHFDISLDLRGKQRHVRGSASARDDLGDGFHWRGRGPLMLARAQWRIVQTTDGRVASLHNPGSMMTEPGSVLLRRVEVDLKTARERLELESLRLGLTRAQFAQLVWRE